MSAESERNLKTSVEENKRLQRALIDRDNRLSEIQALFNEAMDNRISVANAGAISISGLLNDKKPVAITRYRAVDAVLLPADMLRKLGVLGE
ncbi:hypothetical protein [Marinobacterium litorale]|uniref:hypothetical protein n=1 Tax=Marinobacterium litorale TaxID=404770 RepID=UPI000414AF99|nr:hypothetical protein [Marinobacterium litorale]